MDQITHLLDTHAVIWAYEDPSLLGNDAHSVIQAAPSRTLGISDFTLFELALLVHKNRIQIDISLSDLLQRVEQNFHVFPVRSQEAAAAMSLPLHQADPFDRAIVATAHCQHLPLLTKDTNITSSGLVSTVW